jgi:hypothetical protein
MLVLMTLTSRIYPLLYGHLSICKYACQVYCKKLLFGNESAWIGIVIVAFYIFTKSKIFLYISNTCKQKNRLGQPRIPVIRSE